MEKKTLFTAVFISVLFLIATAEACFVKFAQANPYTRFNSKRISPPEGAIPLTISVSSPKNHANYNVNNITLAFGVSAHGTDINAISDVFFTASWLHEKVIVYEYNYSKNPMSPNFWSYNETFWDMPDGEYSVVINAFGGGSYLEGAPYSFGTIYHFDMTTISVVNFTIATPPVVSILSPENATYNSCDIPLDFTVSEKPSLIRYSLDGQERSTLYGNTTLTDLTDGNHSLTIYVWDVAGNPAIPETIAFTISEPEPEHFPATMVIAPSASLASVGVGLLLYFKKRKH